MNECLETYNLFQFHASMNVVFKCRLEINVNMYDVYTSFIQIRLGKLLLVNWISVYESVTF